MPSKEYFRNLARMSRRIARNMTDPAIARRLEAIGDEFEQQAADAPDADETGELPVPIQRNQGSGERA